MNVGLSVDGNLDVMRPISRFELRKLIGAFGTSLPRKMPFSAISAFSQYY